MAVKYVNARQKQRIATTQEWQSNNPILLAGEIGIESDSHKMKAGDGSTPYNSLPFLGGGGQPITKQITLFAASWSSRQYVINDSDIKATSIILFDAPVGTDLTDYSMLQGAVIVAASQTDGQLVLQALGIVPTSDLDVALAIL